ncbi:pyridoxal-phosphate dependent enzyme [Roseomonas sp. CAU 1739]
MAPAAVAAALSRLSPDYAATPLLDLPRLATRLGVAQVLAKDEGRRMLGSFKSLGGTYAGLRALARAARTDFAGLVASRPAGQPALVCASDGNHGLAVAAAARLAGAGARVYLHDGVPLARAQRIQAQGAEIVRVAGTYDDAVDAAAAAAPGLLHGCGGPRTTPSGSAGLAGAVAALAEPTGPGHDARILVLVTETDMAA